MPSTSDAPRQRLTRERVIDAALEIMDADGSDALTFRSLGRALGVDHTAFLRHFRNKDDLILALADRLLQQAVDAVEPSDDWRMSLRALSFSVRNTFRRHPRVATVVAGRTARSDAEFAGADIVIGALLAAGLDGAEAASYYRALVDVALAYAALEASVSTLPAADAEGDRRAWTHEYQSVDADRFPHLASVAEHLPAVDRQDQFDVAFGLLVDAIEVRVSRGRG
ncbi:TetR family transcriptional regulator [Gordonia spumicola]|uniref:TetR family transcriptional regulator n=1 Tax=Gordonia spumicola TaxID=589161 RepID=A0A7I9V9M2_9ACTN|nr:TetR/AcrR family transcriptional regulator C-terminal domain-containing protein [Gordonia spumicola]GEE02096.1 TetR family transcriptional regulator [Gordonia spumicola]